MCLVFYGHFASVWRELVDPHSTAGVFLRLIDADATFGSSFFMLISTFFSYGILRRGKRSFGAFLHGRLWRIYPLYLVMTAIYVAGSLLVPAMSKLPADTSQWPVFLLESLLLVPTLLQAKPLMDVTWTLSFLVLFYFIEGGMAAILERLSVPSLIRVAFLCAMAAMWAVVGNSRHWWEPRTSILWVGMAMSELVDWVSRERIRWAARMVLPAAVFALLGAWLRTHLALSVTATSASSFLLWRALLTSVALSALTWCCYFGPPTLKRMLSFQPLLVLGESSYAFYLTHGIAIKLFRFAIIPWLGSAAHWAPVFWCSQLAGLGLSIWIARLFHIYIDRPLARLGPLKRLSADAAHSAGAADPCRNRCHSACG